MICCRNEKTYDIIVVGAGPIGIETAALATINGYKVLVLESGDDMAYNMQRFAYLDMFSPWYYNYSPYGINLLKSNGIFTTPKSDYEPTEEYITNYLKPLSKLADFKIEYNTKVIKIGKQQIAKTDLVGSNRSKYPFRLLCEANGKEEFFYASKVIDTSGVYDNPLFLGEGRIPAINEKNLKNEIHYQAIDKEKYQDKLRGKKSLLIGTTCCTSKSVIELKKFISQDRNTKIIYINESGLKPYIHQLKNDIFPKRVDGINLANEFLDSFHPQVKVIEKSSVFKIEKYNDSFKVYLNSKNGVNEIEVDNIISNCGFKADNSLYEELQVHECYASHSPMNLATAMLEDTIDCRLTPNALSVDTLSNPEPDFFILGAKSYGRNQGFSLHIGIGQIIELFARLTNKDVLQFSATDEPKQKEVVFVVKKEEVLSSKTAPTPAKVVATKEEKYKTIAENLQEVIFETDLKQKITYLSPSWKIMTGFEIDDFIGLDWQVLLDDDSRSQGVCQCNAFMSNKLEEYHEEFKIKCKDGSVKWVEVRASVLIDYNGVAFGTIGSMVDITQRVEILNELKIRNKQLDELSITDELSDLYNRRYFNEMLPKEFDRALRSKSDFALAMCDIDYFKPYNDTYGHQKGDEVIQEVAKVLKNSFNRQIDVVARYGGEEFVIILPATPKDDAIKLLDNVRKEIENLKIEHINSKVSKYITVSFGMVCGKIKSSHMSNKLFNKSDEALYASKKNGRNQLTVVDI
ncbi:MAG: diguanylate cyclase [Arcobacteraceae bacterium]|nr:diguanylate cyclase [Arcobacteraceae bacterium]